MKRNPQTQLVFNFSTGDKRKARGMRLVTANAGDWKDLAVNAIREVALTHQEFTAADVRAYAQARLLPEPHHPNAWGAAFSTAARSQGFIKDTGRTQKSTQANANGRKLTVWHSLIYGGEAQRPELTTTQPSGYKGEREQHHAR